MPRDVSIDVTAAGLTVITTNHVVIKIILCKKMSIRPPKKRFRQTTLQFREQPAIAGKLCDNEQQTLTGGGRVKDSLALYCAL